MADDDANVQRAKDGNIEEDIGKVIVGDDRAVEADDENFFTKTRDVLKDAAKISWFHFSVMCANNARQQ